MAITQEQADSASVFHYDRIRKCDSKQGPVRYRRAGRTKRWKREPQRFEVPVKYGLHSYYRISNDDTNMEFFHTGADCAVEPEGHN